MLNRLTRQGYYTLSIGRNAIQHSSFLMILFVSEHNLSVKLVDDDFAVFVDFAGEDHF